MASALGGFWEARDWLLPFERTVVSEHATAEDNVVLASYCNMILDGCTERPKSRYGGTK